MLYLDFIDAFEKDIRIAYIIYSSKFLVVIFHFKNLENPYGEGQIFFTLSIHLKAFWPKTCIIPFFVLKANLRKIISALINSLLFSLIKSLH